VLLLYAALLKLPHKQALRTYSATTVHQLEETLKYIRFQFDLLNTNECSGVFLFEASSLLENGISREAIVEVCSKYGFNTDFVDTMERQGGLFEKIDTRDLEVKRVLTAEQLPSRLLCFSLMTIQIGLIQPLSISPCTAMWDT
jgi:hypothetical protein